MIIISIISIIIIIKCRVLISVVISGSPDLRSCKLSHVVSSAGCLIFVSLSWKVSGVGALDAQGGGV